MAIDTEVARFLIECRREGVNFRHTLTLGRQNYFLGIKETRKLLDSAGIDGSRYPKLLDYESSRYAEPFLEALGAERIESLDASKYEGATIVHDLNQPVADKLKQSFDVVCDAGTIEHAINFPGVLTNCMQMVKVGGHLILNTPANNLCGHGFYQFSPELWFRVLSASHGFELRRMVAAEYAPRPKWVEVSDPAGVKERVGFTNRYPVLLLVLARKISEMPVFEAFPQQSDYVPRWEGEPDAARKRRQLHASVRRSVLEFMPGLSRFLENFHRCSWFNRKYSLRNRRFFKPLSR